MSGTNRSIYVLTLQAENEEVHGLRTLLKRLIRDHGLKCIDIHKLEESDMSNDDLFDLNKADKQGDAPPFAPPGLYWLKVDVRPGAVNDDHLLPAKNGYTWHLSLKCTVHCSEPADKNLECVGVMVFDYVTLRFDDVSNDDLEIPLSQLKKKDYETAVRLGKSKLRALLESAYAIDPNDSSEETIAKRRVKDNDFLNLNGLVFLARLDTRKYKDKETNSIDYIVVPGMAEWPVPITDGKAIVSRADELDDGIPFN